MTPPQQLSRAQITHFKREGWLSLRGALDPSLLRHARERLWECIDASHLSRLRRDSPDSWVGPFSAEEEGAGRDRGHKVNCGEFGLQAMVGGEDAILDLFPRALWPIAVQLLGLGTVVYPGGILFVDGQGNEVGDRRPGDSPNRGQSCRGIYCQMPRGPDTPRQPNSPHIDGFLEARGRLAATCYIDDVGPGGGGFGVWPRSHGAHPSCVVPRCQS